MDNGSPFHQRNHHEKAKKKLQTQAFNLQNENLKREMVELHSIKQEQALLQTIEEEKHDLVHSWLKTENGTPKLQRGSSYMQSQSKSVE